MRTIVAIALALSFVASTGTTHRNNSKSVKPGAQDCIIIVDPPGVICN